MEEAREIAKQAYLYGFPMVEAYKTLYAQAVETGGLNYKAPFNTIGNTAQVFTPKDTAIVTPNSDTPYSMMWMDLRAEPLVLTLPEIDPKRFYHVQLIDLYTQNFAYLGKRATGSKGGNFLVAGPNWKGETPAWHPEDGAERDRVRLRALPHPALRPGRHRQRPEDPGAVQGRSRSAPSSRQRRRRRPRRSTGSSPSRAT